MPCGPINQLSDVFADPQVLSRGMVLEIPHPTLGQVKQTGVPIKFSRTQGSVDRHPPLLGEHTDEVLTEVLGFSASEIEALRAGGVV